MDTATHSYWMSLKRVYILSRNISKVIYALVVINTKNKESVRKTLWKICLLSGAKTLIFSYLCYLIVTPPTCFGTGFGLVLIRASITPAVKFCITFHHIYFDFWFPLILVVIMLARLFFWMCAVGMLIANPDNTETCKLLTPLCF